jgi:hypothetical protein
LERFGHLDPRHSAAGRAAENARQSGGLMLAAGVTCGALSFAGHGLVMEATALTTTGVLALYLAHILRSYRRLWAAQALLAIGSTITLISLGIAVGASLGYPRALESICPMIFGLACGIAVTWHSAWAVVELRRVSEEQGVSGFTPLFDRTKTPLPVERVEPSDPSIPPHRSDSSR